MAVKVDTAYEAIGRLLSRERMRALGRFLDMAGVNVIPEAFTGFLAVSCLLISVLSTLIIVGTDLYVRFGVFVLIFANGLQADPTAFTLVTVFFIFLVSLVFVTAAIALLVYIVLILRADARSRHVELVLPDFLTLAAANVRAGMSIDQAMWYAAKPEFGLFSKEVELVAKRAFGGEPFNHALDRLATRFNSKSVRRAVALIKQGLASGGEMAEILERTAEDARNMQLIGKDISASLLMYVIFIVFASCLGTPFMFAVANRLIFMLGGVFAQLPPSSELPATGFLKPSPPTITSEDFFLFTIATTILTSIFASVIIGVIQTGSKKQGLKYVPFFILATLAMFFITSAILDVFFAGLMV